MMVNHETAKEAALAAETAGARTHRTDTSWSFSQFRDRLNKRKDAEHAFGFARLGALVLWFGWQLGTAASVAGALLQLESLFTLCAIAAAAWLLERAARDAGPSGLRRLAGIVLDQGFVALSLLELGNRASWLLPLAMFASIANGLHFGRLYGLLSSMASAAGFAAVLVGQPALWARAGNLAPAVVAMLFLPAYVAVVGERLINASEGYRARARKMARIAMEDPLTRLANRAFFKKCLVRAIERAKPGELEEGFAVLYCDLDNFKMVNDTHGHPVGDGVLRQVAETLRKCVRGSDVVARLGGDEFAVYLKAISDAEIAKRIGRSIVASVRRIETVGNTPVQVACSVGITMFAAPLSESAHVDRILARADEAMFQAKRAGKNQFYLQWANL